MRLNDKKNPDIRQEFLNPRQFNIMKVTTHVHFHHSCESCFPVRFARLCRKKS